MPSICKRHLPWQLSGKVSACKAEMVLTPVSGRSPGRGKGNPFWYPCLGNQMDRRAWWAIVHGFPKVGRQLVTRPTPSFIVSK